MKKATGVAFSDGKKKGFLVSFVKNRQNYIGEIVKNVMEVWLTNRANIEYTCFVCIF